MRGIIKWTAVAVTAVLCFSGCATASAPRAEGAQTVQPARIFAD
jgi:hypothetical protein